LQNSCFARPREPLIHKDAIDNTSARERDACNACGGVRFLFFSQIICAAVMFFMAKARAKKSGPKQHSRLFTPQGIVDYYRQHGSLPRNCGKKPQKAVLPGKRGIKNI